MGRSKQITEADVERIQRLKLDGWSLAKITTAVGVSRSTVSRVIGGRMKPKKMGRPTHFRKRQIQGLRARVLKLQKKSPHREVTIQAIARGWKCEAARGACAKTLRRALRSFCKWTTTKAGPALSEEQRQNRVGWCAALLRKPARVHAQTAWFDCVKISRVTSHAARVDQLARNKRGEYLVEGASRVATKQKATLKKNFGEPLKLAVLIAPGRYRPRIITAAYHGRLNGEKLIVALREINRKLGKRGGGPLLVHQDNDRIQSSAKVLECWKSMGWVPRKEKPPTYSPDLNTCDATLFGTARSALNKWLDSVKRLPSNQAAFDKVALAILRGRACQDACKRFVDSYKSRLRTVIENEGFVSG